MKRAIVILTILTGMSTYATGQTFSEWFQQKKTQKKYLIEQIAALELYGSYVRKGYDISKKGLNMIGDLKDGDFNLHQDYFSKLKSVNPEIAKSPKVKDIISLQERIRQLMDKSTRLTQSASGLTSKETGYISKVYERLNSDCIRTISELDRVINPGQLQMKDDERIERIEQLHKESVAQYQFTKSFGKGITQLILQKDKQQKEVGNLRTWYGIKNN